MRLRRAAASLLAVCALSLAGCSSSSDSDSTDTETTAPSEGAEGAFPASIETKFGTVEVDKAPERVVALGWGDAEAALALGIQPVGASDWLEFGGDGVGPWSEGLYDESPEIIATLDPSYEAIAALKPDLILDVRSSGEQERYDRLSEIATTVGVPEGGDSWLATRDQQMDMISTALGQPEQGQEILDELDQKFADTSEAHPEWQDKTVTVATRTSEGWGAYVDDGRVDFFENLGFVQNPTLDELPVNDNGWTVSVSPEQLDMLDADLLVGFPIYLDITEITEDSGWNLIPAVQDGKDIVISDELSQAFSLGTPAALEYALDEFTPMIEDAVK
ncbi:MAG: iron-siderophore ABC transporter substrate-binding protein [Ancrocorticia sp.]|uniref:iron-siderophore ABC transporter substrate-binding protein n=1 Tax=Ancrocorticia sp. TaxID=2593684 RepID=UPI003F8F83AC